MDKPIANGGENKTEPTEAPEDGRQALAENARRRCGRSIFVILRADELAFTQLAAERARAYAELHETLSNKFAVDIVLAYFNAAEQDRYIRDGAEDDAELTRAIETLRKMDTAPLMIDLPDETAYELWNRAGSWAGALTLAGLEPLDETRRREAAELYAATHESPKKKKKNQKHSKTMTNAERFYHGSYWWRNSEKYRALARGEKPPPWTQNAQTPETHEDSADEK
ncbi:MAG: hypothetical protein LBC28_02675 [Oscillospiraceae bacterium]|nr:hypothetical protein [Oscillospiraceae bacterium]